MNQVIEFFKGLFDTSQWPARWHCGNWTNFHGWLYIVSDLMVWFSYFMIPVIILKYFLKKRAHIKFQGIYLLFAGFILLCGTTHFLDAVMFWVPMYRFNALVRFLTGIISLITVFQLVRLLPTAFSQKTLSELEKEIARREEVEQKLAEANKNLEAFAFVASHDLQEPLRKISLYSDQLYKSNKDVINENSKQLVIKITSSTARLRSMINDLLMLSSLSEAVEVTEVNVAEAVEIALTNLELKIQEKEAMITVGELPDVIGNISYLSSLFMNLISNALKFCDKRPEINIYSRQENGRAKIFISDNGIGMDEKDIEKIFTIFQRLHSRSKYDGSGIGLAISKRIVELHNGKIVVESVAGKGTTFIVELTTAAIDKTKPEKTLVT